MSSGFEGPDNPSQQFLERTSRIRFSKDIVQLWLQSEVVQPEKILRHLQIQSALTPYLFPDPRALCEHLPVIEQLATSGKFLLITRKIVVDILYVLRREDCWALAAITFLEDDLKRGNQYIFCQSFVSTRLVRPRMTRPDSDAWDLYDILEFCKGLLDSSQPGTPDPSSMITIITGIWTALGISHTPCSWCWEQQLKLVWKSRTSGASTGSGRRSADVTSPFFLLQQLTHQTQSVHLSCSHLMLKVAIG